MAKTVLVISDLHLPFENDKAFSFLSSLKTKYNPQEVVMIGDLVDQYALSTYVKGASSLNAEMELEQAEKGIKKLATMFPNMKICLGNHDLRYIKRANEAGLSAAYLKDFKDIVGAPKGWTFAEEFVIDDVLYLHGDGFSGLSSGQEIIKNKFKSCVYGHTHQGSITYLNGHFSMNVGCLVDAETYAFKYAKFFKQRPFIGCGIVIDKVPQLIPLK